MVEVGPDESKLGSTRLAYERAESLALRLEALDWHGPDPYDALLSPFARRTRSKVARQVMLQVVKRSRVDLRSILRIPPIRSATATGMGATACARVADRPQWKRRLAVLAAWTAEAQLGGTYDGLWGYEFDVQTRWSYYPRGEPNIVATTFAADGCMAGGTLTPSAAERLATGLLRDLDRSEYFSYTPTSSVLIHNANLMAASLALRVADAYPLPLCLDERLRATAQRAVATTISCQLPNGSWPYGEQSQLSWIDNFHTGYVLLRLHELLPFGTPAWREALDRGAEFYFAQLFMQGRPKYSLDSPSRVDGNNVATALKLAAWGAANGFVSDSFVDRVYRDGDVETWLRMLSGEAPLPSGHATSPRWVAAPFLDALLYRLAVSR